MVEPVRFLEDEFEAFELEPDNVTSPTSGSPSKKHKGQDGSPSTGAVPPGVGSFLGGAGGDEDEELESTPREDETASPENKDASGEKKKKGIRGLFSKAKHGVKNAASDTKQAAKKQWNKKSEKQDKQEKAASDFASLVMSMSPEESWRVRRELDSKLEYDGSTHRDLRRLVFTELHDEAREAFLQHLREHANLFQPFGDPLGSPTGGDAPKLVTPMKFVVLSDVDDTLLPCQDDLNIAGSDKSWVQDGTLYPGVAQVHRQLRGAIGEKGYSVALTARPPNLTKDLCKIIPRVAGTDDCEGKRLGILPGVGGIKAGGNLGRIVGTNVTSWWKGGKQTYSTRLKNFKALADAKMSRFNQYARVFPEACGNFVFFGDDGQGDMLCADQMLSMTVHDLARPMKQDDDEAPAVEDTPPEDQAHVGRKVMAFVGIHACVTDHKDQFSYLVNNEMRKQLHDDLNEKHPPVYGTNPKYFKRFFYYHDIEDLAMQLSEARWITTAQLEAILMAYKRDQLVPYVRRAVRQWDIMTLHKGLELLNAERDFIDPWERQVKQYGERVFPHVIKLFTPLSGDVNQDLNMVILLAMMSEALNGAELYCQVVIDSGRPANLHVPGSSFVTVKQSRVLFISYFQSKFLNIHIIIFFLLR